jgi:hypothetical protein
MRCWCCDSEVDLVRQVKLRPWREFEPDLELGPDDPAYAFYVKEMTYRWAVICQDCYFQLDNEDGLAPIGLRLFNLAGASRRDRARVLDEGKYQAFQRRQAARMGLQVEGGSRRPRKERGGINGLARMGCNMTTRQQPGTTKNTGRRRREPVPLQGPDTLVYTYRYDDLARVIVPVEPMRHCVPGRDSRGGQRLRATTGQKASGNGN